jgi:hypothetical protein
MKLVLLRQLFPCAAVLIGALLCIPTATVNAAVIFSEDFESITTGTSISTSNSIFTSAVGGGSFLVVNDSVPPIPAGGSNSFTGTKYLQYVDGTAASLLRAPAAISNMGFALSFDYYEPDRTTDTQTAVRVLLSNGETGTASSTNGVRAVEINLNVASGTAAAGTLDAVGGASPGTTAIDSNELVHIDLVGQLGPGTLNYPAGATYAAGSAAQFTYNVYVNGVFAFNATFRNNHAQITEFALASISTASRLQTAYFDNIVLHSIPEPTTIVLIGTGALALISMRKKFRK